MLRQLPQPPSPPLSPSQDVAVTQLSACDSSAVTPSELKRIQRLRPVKSEQYLSPAKTTFVETRAKRTSRREYKKDQAAAHSEDEPSSDLAVIVMYFSQNLTIPSVPCTPSQWYFCSLLTVNVFGIFFENTGTQTNYMYDEFTSGKGSDQINSMLQHFIRTVVIPYGKKHLVVYADNCTGQNKNYHVIKFFLALVHMGVLERVDYKFFVKGHTKNSCDRGFGHIRKHVSRQVCWYKPVVTELYKNLMGVQQYQIFSMVKDQPGVVLCRKGPDDEATRHDLRRNVDGVATDDIKVDRMFTHFLEDLNPPPLNSEKMLDLHNKTHPYVPEGFQDDPIYAKPSEPQQEDAKAAKQACREHRASMAAAANANQDRRDREVQDESRPTPKKALLASRSTGCCKVGLLGRINLLCSWRLHEAFHCMLLVGGYG
ncbi:hypothetical protein PPTG_07154 [Phytophthora nicotianae INRA-310]|uniref:DUF7869 domain-containing protein n=1 Tax=Phytophthora nicotianae (strain INRA-310) TaxID=761204 RepID=W2QQY1_PHYN3|nr:hypothetical protein PPTG_07154 [Phytophthora nicotianae INRA-310]ETN14904.1 hypothetical protein PPTG_07154 [Phytophthora nicotianae INRA-310]